MRTVDSFKNHWVCFQNSHYAARATSRQEGGGMRGEGLGGKLSEGQDSGGPDKKPAALALNR